MKHIPRLPAKNRFSSVQFYMLCTEALCQYLRSLARFQEEAKHKKVDVALSNHTSFDQGLERIAYSQDRLSYMPNIYIIGQEGFQRYCQVFRTLSSVST